MHAGQYPTLKDWETHLTTIFPEVRLKRYMEMRGADGGPWDSICALPALWVGLLYTRWVLSWPVQYFVLSRMRFITAHQLFSQVKLHVNQELIYLNLIGFAHLSCQRLQKIT